MILKFPIKIDLADMIWILQQSANNLMLEVNFCGKTNQTTNQTTKQNIEETRKFAIEENNQNLINDCDKWLKLCKIVTTCPQCEGGGQEVHYEERYIPFTFFEVERIRKLLLNCLYCNNTGRRSVYDNETRKAEDLCTKMNLI